MKVCDRCRQPIGKATNLDILGTKAELCQECASKIVQWLKEPIKKPGFMETVAKTFGGGK